MESTVPRGARANYNVLDGTYAKGRAIPRPFTGKTVEARNEANESADANELGTKQERNPVDNSHTVEYLLMFQNNSNSPNTANTADVNRGKSDSKLPVAPAQVYLACYSSPF